MKKKSFGLIIFPTEQCNLRCVYCYQDFNDTELTEEHYDLLYKEINRKIEDENKEIISISWFGGEPLLKADDIIKFNSRIKKLTCEKNIEFYTSMTTNGVLLDIDLLEKLCNCGVYRFQITLDGFLHDSQRVFPNGDGSFDKIFKNIMNMLESNLDFQLMLRINIPDKNFDFLFYNLFKKYADDKRLQILIRAVAQLSEEKIDLPLLERGISEKNILNQHEVYLKSLGYNLFDEEDGLFSDVCYASKKDNFTIRADGKIGKCTVLLDKEFNDIGSINLKNMILEINKHKNDLWSESLLSLKCKNCKKIMKCFNRSCPAVKIKNQNCDICCNMV